MTIRDKLQGARRKAGTGAIIGWLMGMAGIVLAFATGHPVFGLVFFPGFLTFVVAVLYILLSIRCPQCRGPLGYAISYPTKGWFGISEKIRFCPFCGVELDSELPQEQGPTGRPT